MQSAAAPQSSVPAAPHPGRLKSPIDFLLAEHIRLEAVCDVLDRLVDDLYQRRTASDAAALATYLAADFRVHLADEEEDLFPLLERRCLPEDGFDDIARLVGEEHAKDAALAAEVLSGLERLAASRPLDRPLDFICSVLQFCETQRRHIAWENSTILRLARRRLTADDMVALRRGIAARRAAVPGD